MNAVDPEWISVGIAFLCAIGSFIAYILTRYEKNQAKAYEEEARKQAENADKANISARKYYEAMLEKLNIEDQKNAIEDRKKQVLEIINLNGPKKTAQIAKELGISEDDAFNLLESMAKREQSIQCGGQCKRDNPNLVWIKK